MAKKKVKTPNHKSYLKRAKDLFMPQFRGKPCEVCGTNQGTCGHHVVSQARSKSLRFDERNIIVLCAKHHTMGNELAPHASNQMAVERFIEWFKENKPEQHAWIEENERIERRYTYKDAVENMKAGRKAWE